MAFGPSHLRRTAILFGAIVTLLTFCLFFVLSYHESLPINLRTIYKTSHQIPDDPAQTSLLSPRVPCYGPRAKLLDDSPDDQVQDRVLDIPFPEPAGGSYDELGLPKTWTTPSTRYGAYGYGEDKQGYNRSRVDWETVDWAQLQDDCIARNKHRFRSSTGFSSSNRFALRDLKWDDTTPLVARPYKTGRTALVLRGWDTYNYTPADKFHIRSLIMEASLGSSGEYAVFLLVDIKDKDKSRRIFHDPARYQATLEEYVPVEFRSIAVLFDEELLESWYPKVLEHSVFYQVYQPMQLFAQQFNGFDHYWQLELDSKITGNSLSLFSSLDEFSRLQPRKQSIERSSYFYMPSVHGSYSNFCASVDASLPDGGIWGPVNIPDIPHPIGPTPRVRYPQDDHFTWGVGHDADLILTNALADILTTTFWPFKDWIRGFQDGIRTPRYYSPVAMTRCSYDLLSAIHWAQMMLGARLPSEATPVSFALYHGLKVVFPPHPWFHHPQKNINLTSQELNILFNGGTPKENVEKNMNHGLGFGAAMSDPTGKYELFNGGTWWWVPGYPGRIMKRWMRGITNETTGELPSMLREVDGEVWAPLMALHPVKSGDNH